MTSGLRLAGILDDTPVRLTLELPAAVHRDLIAYAEAVSKEGGRSIEPAKLAPIMLARFMSTDRAFAKIKKAR